MGPSKKLKLEKIFGPEFSPSKSTPKLLATNTNENNLSSNVDTSSLSSFGTLTGIPHCFQATKFSSSICHFCKEVFFIFGYQCIDCGYIAHQKCVPKVPESCKISTELQLWTHVSKSKWFYVDIQEEFDGVEANQTHIEGLVIILNGIKHKSFICFIYNLSIYLLFRKWRSFEISFT